MSRSFDDILASVSADDLRRVYIDENHNLDYVADYFSVAYSTAKKLLDYYGIEKSRKQMYSNIIEKNHGVHGEHYRQVKQQVSKEELKRYYIDEDHGYDEVREHFNLSGWTLDRLIREYELKKDRSKAAVRGMRTKIATYGLDNFNNWQKGLETRIQNSGSLEESYAKGLEKQRETMLERYGVECGLLRDDINRKKKHTGPNERFAAILTALNIPFEREFNIENRSYDFKVGNTLIEINPIVTHNTNFNPFDKKNKYAGISKNYHKEKSDLAKKNGYRCIHVWPWENDRTIAQLLIPRERVYARNCEVREVPLKAATDFINSNHIQGYVKAKIKLGLYLNDELVSIMTFGASRFNKKYQWELIRYCSSKQVIGGANKLFKYFVDHYDPTSIISYCDNSKFNGETYTKLGFTLKSKGTPVRHWCNLKLEHYLDSTIMSRGYSRIIHGCSAEEDNLDTNDNYKLMRRDGFLEVFDCGQSSYIWEKEA